MSPDPGHAPRAILLLNADIAISRLDVLLAYCQARGYRIAGTSPRLVDAAHMIDAGEADVVVCASREDLPVRLEIVTLESPPKPGQARPAGRRPRRLRPR